MVFNTKKQGGAAAAGVHLAWRGLVLLAASALLSGLSLRAADSVVRLPFTVTERAGWFDVATLQVSAGQGPVLRLELRRRSTLITPLAGPAEPLKVARTLALGAHDLRLRIRGEAVTVCLDQEQIGVLRGLSWRGRLNATFTPGKGIVAADKVRLQRLEPVVFADDFAREASAPAQWEASGGRFVLCTSLNPGSSQSAFQMWASAPSGRGLALAVAAPWFWDDLSVGVAGMAPALPAAWGLVVQALDRGTYHAAVWRQGADGKAGSVALVRHRAGADTVLAETPLAMAPGQWYRMTVVSHGAHLRLFLGGTQVLQAEDPFLCGGRIGLLAEDSADVYFDDVDVVSAGPETLRPDWQPPHPFGPCEQAWSDFSQKGFYTDPFMAQWSHPRSFWDWDSSRGLHWFRTRLFHDASISWTRAAGQRLQWPGKELVAVVFGDREQAGATGYRVGLSAKQLTLSRNAVAVAEAAVAVTELEALTVAVAAGRVSVALNGQEALAWTDPEPLGKGDVGLQFGPTADLALARPDWRDTVRLRSSHRLDYSFEHAPTAWSVGAGRWQGDHRWACTPNWSFFAGRGEAGPPECENGNALLWNLRRFEGDFDMEVFAAPLEGTPQRMHYAWPVTVNLAFMADGQNLDSGYLCLFGTYDVPSQLFRDGVPIAEWRGRLNPGLRRQEKAWYQQVTRVWQHLRVCRRGKRLTVDAARHDDEANYLGLERVFEVSEEVLPGGDRMGVWTWGPNGLALARATISFEHSPGTVPAALPGTPTEARQGGKGEPRRFVRVRNPQPGGFFHHDLLSGPLDVDEKGAVSFAARIPDTAVLSLVARVRGQAAEAVLSGPDAYRPYTIPLGRATATPSAAYPGWVDFRIDLRQALRRVFPQGRLVVERLAISSPYDGIAQIAGLGLNRCGDAYDVTAAEYSPSPEPPPPGPPSLQVRVHDRLPLDDFEADSGAWERLGGRDGAALYRDSHEPAAGLYCLRLLNPVIGGPAGAWIGRDRYPLAAFPRLRFDYRMGPDTELNLLVQANGRTVEVTFTGTDSTWPVVGRLAPVVTDGQWHTAEADLAALLRPHFGGAEITVEGLALADARRMSSSQRTACWIDGFCRVPAVDPEGATPVALALTDGSVPAAYSLCVDDKPDTDPGTEASGSGSAPVLGPGVAGPWLHLRARRSDGTWTAPVHLPLVLQKPALTAAAPAAPAAPPTAGPPAAPQILYLPADRLALHRFDWSACPEDPEAQFGEACTRREAWVLRGEGDGVAGAGCIILQNLDAQGFYSAYLRRSGWDPLRWPMVAFDYRFEQPGCALNLALMVNGAMTIVEWTGTNPPGSHFTPAVVGRTAPAVQDGAWHHTEFDLGGMLLATRFPNPETRARLTASELATWAAHHVGLPGNSEHARVRIDNLCLYSNRGNRPAFEWQQPPGTPLAEGYAVAFDENPDTVPAAAVTTTTRHAEFAGVKPGSWFLHVRAKGETGWGPAAHRAIRLEAPSP